MPPWTFCNGNTAYPSFRRKFASIASALARSVSSESTIFPTVHGLDHSQSAARRSLGTPKPKAYFSTTVTAFRGRLESLSPASEGGLDPQQKSIYERVVSSRSAALGRGRVLDEHGGLRGPWNAQVHSPIIGEYFERLGTACRENNSLPVRVYEVGILTVGAKWRSNFEWYAHAPLARRGGLSEAAIEGIKELASPDDLADVMEADELLAYRYCHELTHTTRVSETTYYAAVEGLGQREVVDLTFTMGLYHAVSLSLNAFEVPLPPDAGPDPFPDER